MANSTILACPVPFVNELQWPARGGAIGGRYCSKIALLGNASCCVPCPVQDWIFSDHFSRNLEGAFWIALPELLMQVFLLLSFAVLPAKDGNGHYLNWGLTISVTFLAISMLVPLGAQSNQCYDAITPNDMHSSMACAWGGALLLAGVMGIVSWVLVRSLHTHLRVVWGIELPRWYPLFCHAVGWTLPGLGLAIALPITGVSYQIGPLCLLNKNSSFASFFGWYLTFACIAGLVQLSTTLYCLWVFAKSFQRESEQRSTTVLTTQGSADDSITREKQENVQQISGMYRRKHGWHRVKTVLLLQWRSILLALFVNVSGTFFGVAYIMLSQTAGARAAGQQISEDSDLADVLLWAYCLVANKGDKNPCLDYGARLGISEGTALTAFILLALSGIFTFALMVRTSMFVGWYKILCNPKQSFRQFLRRRSSIEETFVIVRPNVDSSSEINHAPRHEAGDSGMRHETTNPV